MGGFRVSGGAVEELAVACRRAGDEMAGLDVASGLTEAGNALPGSQTAVTTAGVAVRLAAAVRVLGERSQSMASAADRTALSYEQADTAAGRRLRPVGAP